MIRKLVFTISLFFVLNSCIINERSGIVNLIIYDDFVDPKLTYDLIVKDFIKSGLIDSIKIVGRPVYTQEIHFKIDTALAQRYGIPLNDLDVLLHSLIKHELPYKIGHHCVELSGGEQIPISTVSVVYSELKPYKPKIFLSGTECYKFKNECVVKVGLYCKRPNRKKIIEYIQTNINKYTASFINEMWRYEIVKDKLPDNFEN